MAPLKPHWDQPSHPDIQEVIINSQDFASKSLSKISLPPFGLYAKMSFPPCTMTDEPTYATVQVGPEKHLCLNSDLLYINHSCEPSLMFDTANFEIIAGPRGLKPGEELTFFYPSTEWAMAQSFECNCGTPSCKGRIAGAKDMTREQLEGLWINGHIRELLDQRAAKSGTGSLSGNGNQVGAIHHAAEDPTAQALRDALEHAECVVEAAKQALHSYVESSQANHGSRSAHASGFHSDNGKALSTNGNVPGSQGNPAAQIGTAVGLTRRGPTSRELSGEMGGDTNTA